MSHAKEENEMCIQQKAQYQTTTTTKKKGEARKGVSTQLLQGRRQNTLATEAKQGPQESKGNRE